MGGPFSGRRVLVTGGTRGIGRAVSLRLAAEGADVAMNYLSRDDSARAVRGEVRAFGVEGEIFRADISDPDETRAMVEAVRSAIGPPDMLVNCAGLAKVEQAEEVSWESWRRILSINLDGSFNVLYATKDDMIRQGFGRVVMLSSISALRPRPQLVHYSAAKAGVLALVRSCAGAWAAHNVRINAVCPGMVDTDFHNIFTKDEVRRALESSAPARRQGTSDDVANLVAFLASDEAGFITGANVDINGGVLFS